MLQDLLARPLLSARSRTKRTCIIPASKTRLVFVLNFHTHSTVPQIVTSTLQLTGTFFHLAVHLCNALSHRLCPCPASTSFVGFAAHCDRAASCRAGICSQACGVLIVHREWWHLLCQQVTADKDPTSSAVCVGFGPVTSSAAFSYNTRTGALTVTFNPASVAHRCALWVATFPAVVRCHVVAAASAVCLQPLAAKGSRFPVTSGESCDACVLMSAAGVQASSGAAD